MTSGFVSSNNFPSSRMAAILASLCSGTSSGGRVKRCGEWHTPNAVTISPMDLLLLIYEICIPGQDWILPQVLFGLQPNGINDFERLSSLNDVSYDIRNRSGFEAFRSDANDSDISFRDLVARSIIQYFEIVSNRL